MIIEHKSSIQKDKYTDYVVQSFDIQDADNSNVIINANLENIPNDFNVGVIYGGSGSGKTSILKKYFNKEIDKSYFDKDKALISNFDWLSPEDATQLLSSMGLSSVPTWLRPFHVLSNGEQYRANLAYIVGRATQQDIILIDEYTSVVDRDVAKAMSNALSKYIRRTNKKIVLASCHFDIMDWLQPDWIYSPQKGRLEIAASRRQRPKIELQIFRCRYETWQIFKDHHYLSEELNTSCKCFVILYNNKPVCFMGILPMPSGTIQNAFRVSRLVVLPDFQGLGIGMKILNEFGAMYKKNGQTLYIKTSNPSLFIGMKRYQSSWHLVNESNNIDAIKKMNAKYKKMKEDGEMEFFGGIKYFKESVTKSYKYIGEEHKQDVDIINFKNSVYKHVSQSQLELF